MHLSVDIPSNTDDNIVNNLDDTSFENVQSLAGNKINNESMKSIIFIQSDN